MFYIYGLYLRYHNEAHASNLQTATNDTDLQPLKKAVERSQMKEGKNLQEAAGHAEAGFHFLGTKSIMRSTILFPLTALYWSREIDLD